MSTSTSKIVLSVAIVALAMGGGVIFYRQSQQVETLKLENRDLNSKLVTHVTRQSDLESRVRDAQDEARQLQDLLTRRAQETAQARKALKDAGSSPSKASDLVKHWLENMDDPEVTRLANLHQTAQIQRRYLPMFKQLALQPAVADALTKLLVDRRNVALDVAIATVKNGVDPMADPDATAQAMAAQRSQVDAEIKDLLGDSGYDSFRAQEQSLGQSSVLVMLQQSLDYANAPLTEAQANQIQQVLENNHVGHLNDKVVQAIAPNLTTAQAQALQTFYEEQKAAASARRARAGTVEGVSNSVSTAH